MRDWATPGLHPEKAGQVRYWKYGLPAYLPDLAITDLSGYCPAVRLLSPLGLKCLTLPVRGC